MDKIKESHCRYILLSQNTSHNLQSFTVEPFVQKTRGGLIGLPYILKIQYYSRDKTLRTLQLFVKTLNDRNKLMFKLSQNLLFYEKEKLVLMELFPKYEGLGINVNFAPKGYLCEDNAVILEDLTLSDFKLYPKEKPLDLEHCHACLSTIAEFHASSLLYEICKTKSSGKKYILLEEYSNILKDLIYSGGDTDATRYLQESVKGLIALAELEFKDVTTLEELKNVLVSSEFPTYDELFCTLLHGDPWNNNFLHSYKDDFIVDTRLIDYQTVKYGPPCLDVLQFIYTNTRKSFRDKHFDDLLSFYYQKLSDVLHDRALDIGDYLPRSEFMQTCNKFKLQVKLHSVIDRCLTAIPDEAHDKYLPDEDSFNDFIFVNRTKYMVELYNNVPDYREMVSEDLKELREMLFALKK